MNDRITIEQNGAVLVLQNNDNTAEELVDMFRAALLAAGLETPVETGSSSGLVGAEGLWKQSEAIELCVQIEAICPSFGCHVALTGGVLYKQGPRKDCDLILYRIRQCPQIDFEGLFAAMETIGVVKVSGFGFCHKAEFKGKRIDFLAPEEEGGYGEEEES